MPCPYGGLFDFDFDFDFNILTAFIRLGRARPYGAGCPPNLQGLGRVPSIIIGFVPSILLLLFDFISGLVPIQPRFF